MNSDLGSFKIGPKSLAPEILLKIFLYLDCHQTVILRSVCKEFLEIIDSNKSMWRVLDWTQEKDGTAVQALEKFDEKSASTLKEVAIFQAEGDVDKQRLLEVLGRSKDALTGLSLSTRPLKEDFHLKMMELKSNSPLLKSLVLWPPGEYWSLMFPKTRLTRSCGSSFPETDRSSNLQVLWCFNLVKEGNGKLDVSSLVSFANPVYQDALHIRSLITKFSSTLTHLSIHSKSFLTMATLSCPSLRILEGQFNYGFLSWLDAPNLQVVIARSTSVSFLRQLPIKVEEIWLLSRIPSLTAERNLSFLTQVCPQLKVLKLGKNLFVRDPYDQRQLEIKDVLKSFKAREKEVQEGVRMKGIKMGLLEKLVVPTELFEPEELNELRDLVAEVIDIKDYPDFIELEY